MDCFLNQSLNLSLGKTTLTLTILQTFMGKFLSADFSLIPKK